MTPREALARLRDRLRRRQLSEELEAELHFHQQMLERDNRAAGAAPDAARRRSRLQLGNRTALVENTRDAWSLGWLDDMLRDKRSAFRIEDVKLYDEARELGRALREARVRERVGITDVEVPTGGDETW